VSERVTPSQHVAPERQNSEFNVEQSYLLLLARAPEGPSAVTEAARHPLELLIVSFLTSSEFEAKLRVREQRAVVDEVMLIALEPDLVHWADSIVAPDLSHPSRPTDRIEIVRRLLANPSILDTAAAGGVEQSEHLANLKTALDQAQGWADIVRASALFDADFYAEQVASAPQVADLALHYVLHGEHSGLKPSREFNAATYAELNADVAVSRFNRLAHYELRGRSEGRRHRPWLDDHALPPIIGGTGRPTVLLLLHDANYTGAPILGWNLAKAMSAFCNVVVVLRRGGVLEQALADVAAALVTAPPLEATSDPQQMDLFAERLATAYRPSYVIANSVESAPIAVALRHQALPVIALVHEFWPGVGSAVRLEFYANCAALIFPASLVEQSSSRAFRETQLQRRAILPQGRCVIPRLDTSITPRSFGAPFVEGRDAQQSLDDVLAVGRRGAGPFTVIGLGAVEMRKGLDLFMAAATALHAKHPDLAFRFIWIGTWEHALGSQYAAFLAEQYERSDLGDRLHFYPAIDNLEPVYARADALFLSSRLDPLPNVTIDAAFHGVPVVCFDQGSGTAELLADNADTKALVVPYLDCGAAADRIAELANNPGLWRTCSEAIRRLARRSFDMEAYAHALDKIGHDAAVKFANAQQDQHLIEEAHAFEPSIYFPPDEDPAALMSPAAVYLDQTRHINFASPAAFGVILRRPKAGFHPFIYATEAPDFPRDGSRDPLAHYVERGMPAGRWAHPILRPDLTGPASDWVSDAAVALHGHFYYPDHIGELLLALAANRSKVDLFLTTGSEGSAETLRRATNDYTGGRIVVEVVPNVGRDIYAFVQVLRTHLRGRYDIVGHIHGKRSVHTQDFDPDFGDRWRRFLWEHLLGPENGAGDTIITALRQDERLGLVFPENGYLVGWEKNTESAMTLAPRLGLPTPLPDHIEFPAGTMFWARMAALDKLIDADLREQDMPGEPIPIDGTVLHALERMIPLLCENAGYTYATSYIPHIRR
jgi:glycosyltransferase involved in cell wall biosynthesis